MNRCIILKKHHETEPITALQNHRTSQHILESCATHPKLAHGELALEFARFKRVYLLMACSFSFKNVRKNRVLT